MASLLIIVMLAAMLTPDGFRSSLTAFQKKTSNIAPLTATINAVSGSGDFEENARQMLTPEFFMEIGALKAAAKVAEAATKVAEAATKVADAEAATKVADAEAASKVANAEAATKVANAEAATKVAIVKLAAAEAAAASEIRHLTEISLSMRGALNMRTVLESEMNTVFFEVANELEIKKYRTMTEKCRLIGEHGERFFGKQNDSMGLS